MNRLCYNILIFYVNRLFTICINYLTVELSMIVRTDTKCSTMGHHFVLLQNAVNTFDVHGRFCPSGLAMGFQISKEYLDVDANVLLSLNLIKNTEPSFGSIQRNQSQKDRKA